LKGAAANSQQKVATIQQQALDDKNVVQRIF
jgi:hypothetical protein